MSDRGSMITMQVIRLHSIGEHELADDIERVQRRNGHEPDQSTMFHLYGVLI